MTANACDEHVNDVRRESHNVKGKNRCKKGGEESMSTREMKSIGIILSIMRGGGIVTEEGTQHEEN